VEAGFGPAGTAKPELLGTYSAERQKIAQQLIDFDREFARMFSADPTGAGNTSRCVV
jgi:phenol 2-monooxygenase (NADPH)